MPNFAKEIERGDLFNQTILPSVSRLLSSLYETTQKELSNGKIEVGFNILANTGRWIHNLLENDKIQDKMPSSIEEAIFLPQIAGKLGRIISVRPSFRKSEDKNLLSFKVLLASMTTWVVENDSHSMPFQDKQKKKLGTSCMESISVYLRDAGKMGDHQGEDEVIKCLQMKIITRAIDPMELSDMALMSAFVSRYNPSSEKLCEAIRDFHLAYFPEGHNYIGAMLKGFDSPLARYFPSTGTPSSFSMS